VHPLVELGLVRQLTVQQQVGDLQERGALGQLLDRVAAVLEDPGVAVDVGDGAAAGGRVDARPSPSALICLRSAARMVPSVMASSYVSPVRLSVTVRLSRAPPVVAGSTDSSRAGCRAVGSRAASVVDTSVMAPI
jgi:hypothetical protein